MTNNIINVAHDGGMNLYITIDYKWKQCVDWSDQYKYLADKIKLV